MNLEDIKAKLRNYTEEQVVLNDHSLIKCFQREITKDMILDNLLNPERLIDMIEQEPKYAGERKFKLVFELSRNKNLVLVVATNKKLNIVTAIIRYRKWVRQVRLKEWML